MRKDTRLIESINLVSLVSYLNHIMPFVIFGIIVFLLALYMSSKREIRKKENIAFKLFAAEYILNYRERDHNLNHLLARKELTPSQPIKPQHIFSSRFLGKELEIFDACYLIPERAGSDNGNAIRHIGILIEVEPYSFPRFALQNDSKITLTKFFSFVDGIPKADSFVDVINAENHVLGLYAYAKNKEQIDSFLANKRSILNIIREERIQLLMFNKQYCCAYLPGSLKADIDHYQAFEQTAEKLIEALFLDSLKSSKATLK